MFKSTKVRFCLLFYSNMKYVLKKITFFAIIFLGFHFFTKKVKIKRTLRCVNR